MPANRVCDIVYNPYSLEVDDLYYGIEIEVEGVRLPNEVENDECRWRIENDGSLRNAGVEFLSATPFKADEVVDNIVQFYEWKERGGFTTGVRTSTHVHVNVLGKPITQLAAIVTAYILVEPLLFRYCGPVREENIYCVPYYRARTELPIVRRLGEGSLGNLINACKYSALYLEPITRYGTLEFRQAPVFETAGALLTWIDMVTAVVTCPWTTSEEVLTKFRELGEDEFVQTLFGERLTEILRGSCERSFEELMDQYDVETTAELSCCTYNVNNPTNQWVAINFGIEGEGYRGYSVVSQNRMTLGRVREWEPDEFPDYDDDEHDEEEY